MFSGYQFFMKLIFVVLLVLVQHVARGQDGVTERRFAREKEKIKKIGIEEITEFESFQRLNGACDSTKLRATHKYKFDRQGNLVQASDYQGATVKTIVYTRNDSGEYTAKDYLYFDMTGNLRGHEVWKLSFNRLGQVVKEQLFRDKEIIRTNMIEYDVLGQRSSQISDSTHKWTMKYDDRGNLTEFKEWRRQPASDFVDVSTISYQYENDLLVHEVTQSANPLEGSSDLVYRYDARHHLVEMIEKRTRWKRLIDGRNESEITEFRTIIRNDQKGNPSKSFVFVDQEPNPFKCRFYSYQDHGN
jgi:hypothetical protein